MARQRRGTDGGRRPPSSTPLDLPATLGSLLRTTLEQVSMVGEAALERARGSRERAANVMTGPPDSADQVLMERKRRDALVRLGSAVYLLSVRGQLDQVGESPDIARMLANIEELDDALEQAGADEVRRAPAPRGRRAGVDVDDGAVSSADWRPPARSRGERMRVWRPTMPADVEVDANPDEEHEEPVAAQDERPPVGRGRALRRARAGEAAHQANGEPARGGIAFVSDQIADDDELAEYMHEDDVEDRGS